MENIDKILLTALAFIIAFCVGAIAYDIGKRGVRVEAVERGFAEWKVNERGTDINFTWKKQ